MKKSSQQTDNTSSFLDRNQNATVKPIRFMGDDEALSSALKQKHPGAMEALYDRYNVHIQRVLVRVMGIDFNLEDMLHEVFVAAFSNASSLKDGSRLKAWITSIAVFTARQKIRRRVRRRVFWVYDLEEEPDIPISGCDPEEREALRMTYRILDTMPADERIAFALRYIEGMELEEIANTCRVSLSTMKRRLYRAQTRFAAIAGRYRALEQWITEGGRWREK